MQKMKFEYLFFEFESMGIEVLLEFLIREIYAQLLKGIGFENFKTENIENSNTMTASRATWDGHGFVYTTHNPIEHMTVYKLGQSIAIITSLYREQNISKIVWKIYPYFLAYKVYLIRCFF